MPTALIVYSTKRGETAKIAELIEKGLRSLDVEVKLAEVSEIKTTRDLFAYDAYLFGSPTYFGEMTDSMKELLFLAEKAELAEKVGGAFGAYGWTGEAPRRIHGTMLYVFNMNMIKEPLQISSSVSRIAPKILQSFCREIVEKLK